MDSSVHSHLIAQHIQDRMTRATAERQAREARADRPRRRLRWLRARHRAVVAARPLPR